jgi:hypothetical protein
LSSKQCASLLEQLNWPNGHSRWSPRTRKGKCYHCGILPSSGRLSRNLCDTCRHEGTLMVDVELVLCDGNNLFPAAFLIQRNEAAVANPYTSHGYRFCQGNCSTVPRPLNEFSASDSKKCKFCCERKRRARHKSSKR